MIDVLVICALLDEPELSSTDIQERVSGVRRGGSADKSLKRLRERGLVDFTNVNPDMFAKKKVYWTTAGIKFLDSIKKKS